MVCMLASYLALLPGRRDNFLRLRSGLASFELAVQQFERLAQGWSANSGFDGCRFNLRIRSHQEGNAPSLDSIEWRKAFDQLFDYQYQSYGLTGP